LRSTSLDHPWPVSYHPAVAPFVSNPVVRGQDHRDFRRHQNIPLRHRWWRPDRVALFFDGDPPFDAFELQLDKDDVVERSQVFNSELDGGWKVKVSGDGDACLLGEHWQSRRKPTVPRYTNADDDKRMPGELSDCMLIRLRYASLLAPDVTSSDIDVIVDRAAAWNREHGITGVLAIEGESVLQVLEGPEAKVKELFSRISGDQRHQGVVELDCESIEVCHFSDWGMVRRSMAAMLLMLDDMR